MEVEVEVEVEVARKTALEMCYKFDSGWNLRLRGDKPEIAGNKKAAKKLLFYCLRVSLSAYKRLTRFKPSSAAVLYASAMVG